MFREDKLASVDVHQEKEGLAAPLGTSLSPLGSLPSATAGPYNRAAEGKKEAGVFKPR